MTVADNTSRNQYTATSGQTVFAYTFEIVDKSHIVVLKNGVALSEGTNYTVSNVGNDSGGNITLTVGATTGDIMTFYRDMPYSRTQNYTNSGDFLASEVNSDFDDLWLAGEQTDRSFSQSIRKPITDSDSISMELPEAASRANKYLSFSSTGAVAVQQVTPATDASVVTYTPAGTGAVQTTVQTKLRESVSVKDFGAVGDGVTDDSAAIKAAIVFANDNDKMVFVPAGTYSFGGNGIDNGGLLNSQDIGSLRLRGVAGKSIFKNGGWIHASGVIDCSGMTFEDFTQAIYMTGTMTDIQVSLCVFDNCQRSIIHNDSTVGVTVDGGLITNNTFKDFSIADAVTPIRFRAAPEIKNLYVTYNEFKNIKATGSSNLVNCCYLGDSSTGTVDKYVNNHFDHNTITDCGNEATTFPGAASHGCIVVGTDNSQNNNTIHDNYWMTPVYAKGNGNYQCFNHCRNNQFGGVAMKTYDTTLVSKENFQIGNVVTGQCDKRAAIRMFGSGISTGSQVEITTTAQVDAQGGLAFQATRSLPTTGRLQVEGNFKAPKGIEIDTAGDVSLDVRLISSAEGINISDSADGLLGHVTVKGQIECETGEALRIQEALDVDIRALQITTNYAGYAIFLLGNNKLNVTDTTLRLTDTAASGTSVTSIFGMYAGSSSTVSNCLFDVNNFNFYTERDFTQLFIFNDGTSPAPGNSICKLQVRGATIDLNGKTGSYLGKSLSNFSTISLADVDVIGSLTRTIDGGGKTVDKLIINNCITDYVATDNVASHTNMTATASRIVNNKTA